MKYKDEVKTERCGQCSGSGTVKKQHNTMSIEWEENVECPVCDGYGFVVLKNGTSQ